MEKLKVLVVNDNVIHKRSLIEAINSTGMGSVVHTSTNGTLALEWLVHNEVNIVMLDAVIQGKSNIDTLRSIKNQYPCTEVIMVSDGTPQGVAITLEGLQYGAFDFIPKMSAPACGNLADNTKNQLMVILAQVKIKQDSLINRQSNFKEMAVKRSTVIKEASYQEANNLKVNQFNSLRWDTADLVLIAASTGGPAALEVLCGMFPADFEKPVLIVQHMPSEFTKAMAESLGKKCRLPIAEGKDGDIIRKRNIMISPGGIHMIVENTQGIDKIIRLENAPHVNGVRPAADVLFKSVANAYRGKKILVVILTGMGNDGTNGVKEIKTQCNCYCMVQSEKTCVVYGMPRCVYEAGLADEVVDLNDITPRVCQMALGRS